MKLDICTKHLRILDLINFTRGESLDFLESSLSISRPNLNNYLKEIHKEIPSFKKTGKMEVIVQDILNATNLSKILFEKQGVSKEDRIFFMILKLLIKSSLNLDTLAKELKFSRRTLNLDLLSIRESLKVFDLEIKSLSGKGIFLEGEFLNIKLALNCYIYKYLVEKEYLPPIFKKTFDHLFESEEADSILNLDIETLVSKFNFDTFFYNRVLLRSFYYSFYHLDASHHLDSGTIEHKLKKKFDFETYFSKVISKGELDSFYDYIHNSVFKNISFHEIGNFLNILKICSANFPEERIFIDDHVRIFQDVITKAIGINLTLKEIRKFERFIVRAAFSQKQKHYLPIYELEFLNLNIDINTAKESILLYNEFKLHYWNISFVDVLMLYFSITSIHTLSKKEVYILYKEIPKYLLSNLKAKLEAKHNIVILDIINISQFEEFRKTNSVKTVGVFKDFEFLDNSLTVIHLDLKF
ncbi:MAG: helix-turn-helix domain-containing protein [Cetobacterium sp.]